MKVQENIISSVQLSKMCNVSELEAHLLIEKYLDEDEYTRINVIIDEDDIDCAYYIMFAHNALKVCQRFREDTNKKRD